MPGTATRRRSVRCRSRGQRPHLQPHTTRRPTRLASSGQLMGQGNGLLISRLDTVPLVHRLVADDRLAVMLAKALVELDIAVPGDWKRAERDPTSFIRITLERLIKAHGGSAIRQRFLLSAVISNTPWIPEFEKKVVGKKNGNLESKVKALGNRELLLALPCSLDYHCGQGRNGKWSFFESCRT